LWFTFWTKLPVKTFNESLNSLKFEKRLWKKIGNYTKKQNLKQQGENIEQNKPLLARATSNHPVNYRKANKILKRVVRQ